MTYQRGCTLLAAAAFLVATVLVVLGAHAKGVEECLFGGLTLFAVAHA